MANPQTCFLPNRVKLTSTRQSTDVSCFLFM